jgi:hypothetical protein
MRLHVNFLQPAVQGERNWHQLRFGNSTHWFGHEFFSPIRRIS